MILELVQRDPRLYVIILASGILSIVLHELGHGFAALSQGDDTPRLLGHITWNPVVHMGWFSLALMAVFGIGFGRTPVNPARFRSRWGEAFVSAAGPLVNFGLFVVAGTVLALLPVGSGDLGRFFYWLALLNVVLFVLNLLPVPPLDGSTVVANASPGYARFIQNPNNQPFITGGLLLAFVLGGRILFPLAQTAVASYAGWVQRLVA